MRVRQIHYGHPWPLNLSWQEDPVRPELSREFRHTAGREVWTNEGAIICVAYCKMVPTTVDQLTSLVGLDHAIFYTVWSRRPGAGRTLVNDIWSYLLLTRPWIKRYVTLSPKTKMAYNFHIKNGAIVLSQNETTDNYEYKEKERIKDGFPALRRTDGGPDF